MEKIEITSDFITLGQFIKFMNLAESGGMVKMFLIDNVIFINGELENRRGKKIYPNDLVKIIDIGEYLIIRP